ncbi:hypothetical protein [Salinirubrum litoreum]|uniref:Uncharacterized protein n=1 Tax=Salinirubrum litoreum TaxID=1126234 RepID=A0ABD5RBE4_9EURY|nr:hypothetical protein [Salinirubrum litoreum]
MVGEPTNGEKARIKRFIETPRSRRHPDMLVPDDADSGDGSDADQDRSSHSAA